MMPKEPMFKNDSVVRHAPLKTVSKWAFRQAAKRSSLVLGLLLGAGLVAQTPSAWSQREASGVSAEAGAPAQSFEIPTRLWTDAPASRDRGAEPLRFNTFADLAEQLSPAVVNIDVTIDAPVVPGARGQAMGQGSGFLIHRDGFVVTNAHVVHRAKEIQITTADRRTWDAVVVGSDEATDLALVRIIGPPEDLPRGGFPVVRLGDSSKVRPGEWVIAIGNPFGLQHSVTAGIVSALGRREIIPGSGLRYADFIQFDAAINLGNSGGPLININGEVVGVNTALRAGNDIGFAIPINMVKTLLPQLGRGEVIRASLGVVIRDLSAEEARALAALGLRGARVDDVVRGGSAANAGVQRGDIITRFDGVDVEDAAQLRWLIAIREIGQAIPIDIRRGNDTLSLSPTLSAPPAQPVTNTPSQGQRRVEGLRRVELTEMFKVETIAEDVRVSLGIGELAAVLVTDVEQAAVAWIAGLREGDLLTHIDNRPVSSSAQAQQALRSATSGQQIQLRLRRGRAQLFIAFTVP